MGMTIDEHIGVIEDLKSTMSVCMPKPEKTEICTSLSKAIDTMRKYQKIQEIYQKWNEVNDFEYNQAMLQIGKLLESEEIPND